MSFWGTLEKTRRKVCIGKIFKVIKRLQFPHEDLIISKVHSAFLCPMGREDPNFSAYKQQLLLLLCVYFQFYFSFFRVIRTKTAMGDPSVCRMSVSFGSPSGGRYVISIRGRLYHIHNHQLSLSQYGQLTTISLSKAHKEFRS